MHGSVVLQFCSFLCRDIFECHHILVEYTFLQGDYTVINRSATSHKIESNFTLTFIKLKDRAPQRGDRWDCWNVGSHFGWWFTYFCRELKLNLFHAKLLPAKHGCNTKVAFILKYLTAKCVSQQKVAARKKWVASQNQLLAKIGYQSIMDDGQKEGKTKMAVILN